MVRDEVTISVFEGNDPLLALHVDSEDAAGVVTPYNFTGVDEVEFIIKAGVAATRSSPPGADVQVVTEGGLLLETALGGQKFVFRQAVLTRGRRLNLEPAV